GFAPEALPHGLNEKAPPAEMPEAHGTGPAGDQPAGPGSRFSPRPPFLPPQLTAPAVPITEESAKAHRDRPQQMSAPDGGERARSQEWRSSSGRRARRGR